MSDAMKCATCGRVDYMKRIQVSPPMTETEVDASCPYRDGLSCSRTALAARDAELAQLRAAVPADVAETIRDLYSRANALTVQVPGMTITALTMREAAHALESLAAENARLKASVPADVAGLVKRLHGIGYMSSTAIDAADALESQARELAAKDERIVKLEAFADKVDTIRDDIIGRQRVGWSAHIYPLVAALGEIGREGVGYDKARAEAEKHDAYVAKLEAVAKAARDAWQLWDGHHHDEFAAALGCLGHTLAKLDAATSGKVTP